ncbi:hypothetical protein pmac_cds_865 [Pandoravirus macleodensis]|uniref:Uncharacterized protein n=1 Tax=Pandoravirus macleodensis TaxID=2107707 RepID=A0A2U7UGB9_9VIRU|nr:hypothetical protein pmac_cds_865 [Pandoravirus macleodensis]AVK77553.1 hypothetical protein pmac_cds_865 [Pandoravirus macleodensis]
MASRLRVLHYVVVTYADVTDKDIDPRDSVADCLRSQYPEYIAILEGDIDADDTYQDLLDAVDKCKSWTSTSEERWVRYAAKRAGRTLNGYATVVLSDRDVLRGRDSCRFDVGNIDQANLHFEGVDVVCRIFVH